MTQEALREIFINIQIFATIISVLLIFYVVFQKPSQLQKQLLLLVIFVSLSNVGYLIELMGTNFETCYVGCCIGYASKPYSLVAALCLLFEYTNFKVKKRYILSLTAVLVFISCLVFWQSDLYYPERYYDASKWGSPLYVSHGIFWYVYMIISFLIFICIASLTFYEFKNSKTKTAKQMAVLLFAVAFSACLGLILFISGLAANYDSTIAGMLVGSFVLTFLFARYRIFDLITEAKNKALDDSKDGIIVLDARMSLSFFNKTAQTIFPDLKNNLGRKEEGVIISQLEKMKEDNELIWANKNYYKLIVSDEIVGRRNLLVGRTFKFTEVTEHYNMQANLNAQVDKKTRDLRRFQREALASFADVIEARDGNTGQHVRNVSSICRAIANGLRVKPKFANTVTDDFVNTLVECAPLHDVGKIYISDTILLKPGKLTPEEFEIMKTHSEKGAEIIQESLGKLEEENYISIAKNIALYHHERFDGTGYPKKLKGEEIPLCARILAIADVYDALRSERTYKPPYDKEKAIGIIKEESGTHFDPEIVEAFVNATGELY